VINKSNAEILIVSAYLPATLDMIGRPSNWSAEDKRPGPSARGEAHAMYATLLDWTMQYPKWLLGGDLNETRNDIDRKHLESKQTKRKGKKTEDMREKQKTEKKNQRSMQKFVNHFLEESRAVDVWRHIYPDTPGHTYRNEQTGSFSRLDYFLLSPSLVNFDSLQMSIGNWDPGKDHCRIFIKFIVPAWVATDEKVGNPWSIEHPILRKLSQETLSLCKSKVNEALTLILPQLLLEIKTAHNKIEAAEKWSKRIARTIVQTTGSITGLKRPTHKKGKF
jgi:exonuclease III